MIAANAVTFAYPTLAAPTSTVVVRAPSFGNRITVDRRDVIEDLPSGELAVFKRGPTRFLLEWSWDLPAPLNGYQRQDFVNFFASIAEGPSNEFELKVPNWGGVYVQLYAGATIAGSTITAGGAYNPGDLVRTDHLVYVGCTFEDSAISHDEVRNGWFAGSSTIRAKGATL